MLFTSKAAAREARAARKATAAQYKALQAIYMEGALEITIRSGSHEVRLTPPLDALNPLIGDLSETLRKRWLALQQEELRHLADWEDEKEYQKQAFSEKTNAAKSVINPAADAC